VASTSAQKDRIYLGESGSRQNPGHSEPPSEINRGDEDDNVFLGRSANSNCGSGHGSLDSLHHYSPCDEDVESNGVNNSDSISTRFDPVTKAPSDTQEYPTDVCVSSDGIFGNILDTASLMTLPITYLYEMQTVAGTDQELIDDNILPKLEKVIMDSILPEAFPTKCAATAIGKRKQKRKLHRSLNDGLLEVIGVSMYPPDDITTDCKCLLTVFMPSLSLVLFLVCCMHSSHLDENNQGRLIFTCPIFIPFIIYFSIIVDVDVAVIDILIIACEVLTSSASSDSTSECFVIKGQLSIFLDEDQVVNQDQIIQMQESINNLIEKNMNSGVYDEASEEITKLHYLEKRDPTESNISDANDGDGQVEKRNNRSLRMGLFVGLGTLAAVLAGVIFRLTRRMRNNDDQTEMQNSQVQTYLDVEGQRRSASFS
jgi:hypothetical protein